MCFLSNNSKAGSQNLLTTNTLLNGIVKGSVWFTSDESKHNFRLDKEISSKAWIKIQRFETKKEMQKKNKMKVNKEKMFQPKDLISDIKKKGDINLSPGNNISASKQNY